jgi:hypothetical protein
MIHFIRQMEAYSQLEVIECSWKELMDFINKKEGDLDALINAHRSYLDQLVKKMLMLSNKSGREVYLPPVCVPDVSDMLCRKSSCTKFGMLSLQYFIFVMLSSVLTHWPIDFTQRSFRTTSTTSAFRNLRIVTPSVTKFGY